MINNNIDDSKNEILFWKVIRNKYTFKLIFNYIQTEWVKINDISDFNIGNRMKFKDITSLDWMIKHKQFSLLKCKLENGEHIDIEDDGIRSLFSKRINCGVQFINDKERDEYIIGQLKEIGYYRIGDEKKILQRNEIQLSNKETISNSLKESLQLLIKYKRDQLIEMDIISIILSNYNDKYINDEMIKVAINKPYSLPVSEYALQLAIDCPVSVLEILLNSPTIQMSNHFKNNSVSWSIFNSTNNYEMTKFILNNSQLYNIPTTTTTTPTPTPTTSTTPVKRFKNLDGFSTPLSTNDEDNGIIKVRLLDLFSIHSSELMERLYKLNYIKYDDIGYNSIFKPLHFKDFFRKYCLIDGYIKEYYNYMRTYDEMIDHIYSWMVYEHAICRGSVNALKYLLSNNLHLNYDLSSLIGDDFEITNEYIKYYSNGYDHFRHVYTDIKIRNYMYSLKSESKYQDAYNSISNDSKSFKSKFSSKWFDISKLEITKSKIVIKNTSTIDLIVDNIEYIKKSLNIGNLKGILQFSSYQLIKYVNEKYPRLIDINDQYLYYPFSLAIYNCDIEQLMGLNSVQFTQLLDIEPVTIDGEDKPLLPEFIDNYYNIVPFNFKNQTTSNVIQLVDYLNSTGYQFLSDGAFIEFIKCICATPSIDLSKLEIDFNLRKEATTRLFIDSIQVDLSLKVIQLILNNHNPFNSLSDEYLTLKTFNFNINTLVCYGYHFHGNILLYFIPEQLTEKGYQINYCTSSDPIQDIIAIIKLSLDQLNSGSSSKVIDTIQDIVNILFKRLIKVRNVSFEQVDSTYQFISSKWLSINGESFKFQHNLYHIINYLGIKSLKFIRFISTHYLLDKYLHDIQAYTINNDYEDDVLKYLDPSVYTYEFIFNSSFFIVLEKLIQDLVYSISPKFSSNHQNTLNSTLVYFLEIREFDLFFKHLDIIKQQLHKHHQEVNPEIKFIFSNNLVASTHIVFNDYQLKQFAEFNLSMPING